MNPWVFRQIMASDSTEPSAEDYRILFRHFIERLDEFLPERIVLNRMKGFIGWVTKGLHKGTGLRRDVYAAKSLPELVGVFERYFELDRSAEHEPPEMSYSSPPERLGL
jgi:tRNA-dihydrouridine synthase